MQIKRSFAIAFLLASSLLQAKNTLHGFPFTGLPSEESCSYAAPSNFHLVENGTDFKKFAWDTPPSPRPHRVRIYRTSDGFLLNTTNVPAGVDDVTITGLPLGINMDAQACAVCVNGDEGEIAEIVNMFGFILNLVVKGFTDLGSEVSCTVSPTSLSCPFISTGTTFKITPIPTYYYPSQKFYIWESSTDHYKVAPEPYTNPNAKPPITLICSQNFENQCDMTQSIIIKGLAPNSLGIVNLATFDVSETSTSLFSCSYLNPDYIIETYSPGLRTSQPTTDRTGFEGGQRQTSTASPNPFSESLDIYLGQASAERVQLQLYNLSGQKVLDQQFTGGQEQYTLSTPSISPGFYLLRIEADGEVQTLKIVKSE